LYIDLVVAYLDVANSKCGGWSFPKGHANTANTFSHMLDLVGV